MTNIKLSHSKVAKVERLEDFDDEWVYDVGIDGDTPYFFGNNILVHNSAYFSVYNAWHPTHNPEMMILSPMDQFLTAYDIFKDFASNPENDGSASVLQSLSPKQLECIEIMASVGDFEEFNTDELFAFERLVEVAFPEIEVVNPEHTQTFGGEFGPMANDFNWDDKDAIIKLYDDIAEKTNITFPAFMNTAFNTGLDRGAIIAAGREIVAENALYIKKKRYAALVIDNEGKRYDVDGKPGKLKAMGLETKRSDTPAFVQDFLENVLIKVLKGVPEDEVLAFVKEFREEFVKRPGWQKGRPTAIKGLTKYGNKLVDAVMDDIDLDSDDDIEFVNGKVNMPGHVRGALNFNNMLELFNDHSTAPIRDGDKVIVCQLKPNNYGITSIARPVDILDFNLPQWFKELPFDHEKMENSMIDVKIENLIGILNWNLKSIADRTSFGEIFTSVKTDNVQVGKKESTKKQKISLEDNDLFSF